ncbi:phosphoribosylglycinamide formyltransferase [Kiloniella litopenaei]|uniref:Phosphoribosylglycinamide formyltransferase n=1 Tax=Kiloniella litopenaei TaxID=1549748 RepID=A0A0M2R403_9PROT|nr:phosphoribosylglycinamide formyltransferase [Kiloniella litopenaei]KKJ76612.1 phosphoribosylglycinamide formyltransferase [Kiloniella litopenaei]
MARLKVGVLISGRGSNLQALLDAAADPSFPAEIVLVVSNVPDVAGLDRAKKAGVATATINHRDYKSRLDFDNAVTNTLENSDVEFVCLAGFMRLVTKEFVEHWHNRMINIHPALLPLFPGLDTHQRALDEGCKLHGCTVHFVRHEMDSGPIVGQAAVPVLPDDTESSLAARVLTAEHRLYPECLKLIAEQHITISDNQLTYTQVSLTAEDILSNP